MSVFYASIRAELLLVQTIVAVLIFGFYLPKSKQFYIRMIVSLALGGLISHFSANILYFPSGSGIAYVFPRTLFMLLGFAITIVITYAIYDVSGYAALFTASAGYAAQNIAGNVKTVLRMIPVPIEFSDTTTYNFCLDILCYGVIYFIIYTLFHKKTQNISDNYDDRTKALFSLWVMIICIGVSRLTQLDEDRTGISNILIAFYSALSSLLVLQVQFGIMENHGLNRDMEVMKELVHEQKNQFENSKESAQLISEKYHDLKQMIGTLSKDNINQKEIQKLESSLEDYNAFTHTGNEILDVILTEKKMLCRKEDIQITCIAGGVDLDFMDELDRYSLFSNIMTNAIEAVEKILDKSQRHITLTITEKIGMVVIHQENSCPDAVLFKDGIPISTRDSRYHGFGMKSMGRIVSKYNGTITANQCNNIFFLDIVLEK